MKKPLRFGDFGIGPSRGAVAASRAVRPPSATMALPQRIMSGLESCSILITSAPSALRNRPAPALASSHDRSIMRIPDRANGLPCGLSTKSGRFCETWTRGTSSVQPLSTWSLCSPRSGARGPVRHGTCGHSHLAPTSLKVRPSSGCSTSRNVWRHRQCSSVRFSSGRFFGAHVKPASWNSRQIPRSNRNLPLNRLITSLM